MPINVTCPNCHTRFKVSEKFAGKKGPCPKCKEIIQVPSAEEQVVIHAPEHSEVGARDSKGQLVLKPIARQQSRFNPVMAALITLGAVVVMAIAFFVRDVEEKQPLLLLGALVLAPPIALGGYSFLRDDELEPHRGQSLLVRTLICSVLYAALWGAYTLFYQRVFGDSPVEVWSAVVLAGIFLPLGGGIALACYDLEFFNGVLHYAFYLLVTILLRLTMGLAPI